jgi:hypothetical protein
VSVNEGEIVAQAPGAATAEVITAAAMATIVRADLKSF